AFALAFFVIGISTVISTEPLKPEGIYLSQGGEGYFVIGRGLFNGIKVEDQNLADFFEFRARLKGDTLILEYSPINYLDTGEWSGPLEYRPSQSREGDWDLIRHSQIKTVDKKEQREIPPLSQPIISALHRLDDQLVVQYFKTKEPSGR